MEIIKKFCPHSGIKFILLISDLLKRSSERVNWSSSLCKIIRAVLVSEDMDKNQGATQISLDDSCLVSILEVVTKHPCEDLFEVAYHLLLQRMSVCPVVTETDPNTSCRDGLVTSITMLTNSLLFSGSLSNGDGLVLGGSIPIPTGLVPVPIGPVPVPTGPVSAYNRINRCYLGSKPSECYRTCQKLNCLLVKADLLLDLSQVCVTQATLTSAELLLLLCKVSKLVKKHFEDSLLLDICKNIGNEESSVCYVSLHVISKYLECTSICKGLNGNTESIEKSLKIIRKNALKQCVEMVCYDSSYPLKHQVRKIW